MSDSLSVTEAAERLGVNPSRIHARIREGSLAAQKVGQQWSIAFDDLRHVSGQAGPGRPLSARSAWALLAVAANSPAVAELSPPDRSRARKRFRELLDPDAVPLDIHHVEAWLGRILGNRSARRLFVAAAPDLQDIRSDERLHLSGVSRPESNISSGDSVEGYISEADVDALVDDYLLSSASRRQANVVLHVVGPGVRPPSLALGGVAASPLAVAADLSEYGDVREVGEAVRLLADLRKELHG